MPGSSDPAAPARDEMENSTMQTPNPHGDERHRPALPIVERRFPVHVPVSVEQYALELAARYGGDVEDWVRESISFHHRLLLRHDRSDDRLTHALHTTVDARTFAAVQASGTPRRFVRDAVREKVERTHLDDTGECSEVSRPAP